jgi:signal transduction histidine kinase
MSLDMWLSGDASVGRCLAAHPIHLFFLAHPLLFAVVFGAMGTVRHRKDAQIRHLVGELERHVDELAEANEKLKELDHLKARFMANVTHELKTPLVSIRGYTEAILEGRFGPLAPKQREGLSVALRNVDRLQKLIDELLEFERLDSGEFTLAISDFDLVPLVGATLQTLRPQVEAKRLSVQLRLPEALPVRADRERIQHVLLNLVSNAVKFAPEGSAIGVAAAIGETDAEALLTVWDRGPGIPTAAHKFLFTRFWQAEGASRKKHGGTGLGLAIVKGILDAHGSTIRIVSSEGAGTEVRFNLPLAERRPAAEEVRHEADA